MLGARLTLRFATTLWLFSQFAPVSGFASTATTTTSPRSCHYRLAKTTTSRAPLWLKSHSVLHETKLEEPREQPEPGSLRASLRKATGFSLTALRTTCRAATGISLSAIYLATLAATGNWIRQTTKFVLSWRTRHALCRTQIVTIRNFLAYTCHY